MRIFIDQYRQVVYAKNIADLAKQCGCAKGTPRRLYRDKPDGKTVHAGYAVGHRWFNEVAYVERPI